MKKTRWPFFLLLVGVVCVLLFVLLFIYFNDITNRTVPTFPRVTINTTIPQGTVVVNQPVTIFGEASDPDGIESAELWVNGEKVASQANTSNGQSPFEISQSWIPDGPGNYLFLLRGVDRKGFAGESTPVMIQVVERSFQPDLTIHGQYIVQKGDTIASIAARFGTTPDEIRILNPGLGDLLTTGESLSVPPRPETAAGGGSPPPPASDSDEPPHVSPPPPPSTAGGTPAEHASAPWWDSLPLPGSFDCILNPAMCASPAGGDAPQSPASDVHASLVDACQTSVSWTDNSSNEEGFRVYRLVMRPRFRFELLALLAPTPGSGTRSTYLDASAPTGQFFYAIVTINSLGEETWSVPSEQVTTTCPSSAVSGDLSIDVEALQMTATDASIDRLYCYISLAGSAFERIPQGASDFITMESGTWNIADYASGVNKRTLWIDGTRPLEIIAECLGRQGDTLINMGRFTRSHPPEEWDGRLLTAGPIDGAFSVTYRIQPSPPDGSSGYGGGAGDPTVPVPFNLRITDTWVGCWPAGRGSIHCENVDEPGVAWDYVVDPAAPRRPLYFKVYMLAGGTDSHILSYTTLDGWHMNAPYEDCGSYVVSAVVGHDPITGAEIQSSVSEALDLNCGQLEITLEWLKVRNIDDGDIGTGDYEANGVIGFMNENHLLYWNDGLSIDYSSYTVIDQDVTYYWADMFLGSALADEAPGNNIIRVPIQDGQPLRWRFVFVDSDESSDSDVFCETSPLGSYNELMPARSLAEWLTVDEGVVYMRRGPGNCAVAIHVRGIPVGTP